MGSVAVCFQKRPQILVKNDVFITKTKIHAGFYGSATLPDSTGFYFSQNTLKPAIGADLRGIIRKNPALKINLNLGPGYENLYFIKFGKKSTSESYTFCSSDFTKSTSSRMYFSEKSNRIPAAL
jgi:hypothetical protein